MLRTCFIALALTISLTSAEAADGTNTLVNGTFDTDVAEWTASWVPPSDASFVWDPKDADNRPDSGSGLLTVLIPGPTTKCVRQCSDILEGGMEYRMRAMLNNPIGQTGLGWGDIRLAYYAEPNCGGLHLGSAFVCQVLSTGPDEWLECAANPTTPSDTQSALVYLCVSLNTVSGTLGIGFDNVKLFCSEVMDDDFESGDFSGWSAVFP
jgi:hypothetical protein